MKPTILTVSGSYFNYEDPDSSEYTIEDIAHALSHTCRFAGHSQEFYSVAQHCVLACAIVEDGFEFEALMHDAAEAFIGDIPSPLKILLPDFKVIEQRVEDSIAKRFGLPMGKMHPEVKKADLIMLRTEQRDIMKNNDVWHVVDGIYPHPTLKINPWPPKEAKRLFLNWFYFLSLSK